MAAKKINNRVFYFLYVLVTGQTLSLLFTGYGVFITLLNNHADQDISITLASGVYFVLSATCGPYIAYQKGFVEKLKKYWWIFLLLGLVDVQGLYLQNLALKYTTVTSNVVTVNGASMVFVILLSMFLIKTRYKFVHFAAMLICFAGLMLLIYEDLQSSKSNAGRNHVLGDLLSVAAALAQTFSLVLEEFFIKGQLSITDYMALLGFGGAIVASIQICILDRKTLLEMTWDLKSVLYFLGYNVCNIGYYYLQPIVLIFSSSMVINLSTLTANVYSLIFSIFLFSDKFSAFYIGGFVVIMFGLVLYNLIPAPEGGTDKSVFSFGYWYSYVHSLFCEWRCCPRDSDANSGETRSLIVVNS